MLRHTWKPDRGLLPATESVMDCLLRPSCGSCFDDLREWRRARQPGAGAAQGKYTEAFAEYDQARARYSEHFRVVTYALAGRQGDARRIIEEMEQRSKREYVSPAVRGLIWVALGEKDRGYALLGKACAERDWRLRDTKVEPTFDSLRAEPRFHEMLKCIHLE